MAPRPAQEHLLKVLWFLRTEDMPNVSRKMRGGKVRKDMCGEEE